MSNVFAPKKIANLQIKNRFVHSSKHEDMVTEAGKINDELIKRYRVIDMARGKRGTHSKRKWFDKRLFRLTFYLIILTIAIFACSSGGGSNDSDDNTDISEDVSWDMPRVPSIVEQFISINGVGGYPFTFRYWNNQIFYNVIYDGIDDEVDCSNVAVPPFGCLIGDDPTLKTHYQGINRVFAPDGTSYLYLTRNGNPITLGDDYPGEILVVKMDGRNQFGEAFGIDYNDATVGDIFGIQQPRADDFTVLSKHLNGIDFNWVVGEENLSRFIDWKHPGSGQQAGNRLFIPVEKTCNYEPDNDKCGDDEVKRGAILVLKLADDGDQETNPDFDPDITPLNPKVDCQIDFYWDPSLNDLFLFPTIGTLAVIKSNGSYLFAHTTGGGYEKTTAMTFYEVDETNLCDFNTIPGGGDMPPVVSKLYVWNADMLQSDDVEHLGEDGWREDQSCAGCDFDWQVINFLHDTQDDLYLVTTDKSNVSDIDVRNDFARLYKITYNETNNTFVLKYIAEKHFYLNTTNFYGNQISVDLGSFDAAGGVYVSPEGRLILYSGSHDNDLPEFIFDSGTCNGSGLCKGVGLGEFPSLYDP